MPVSAIGYLYKPPIIHPAAGEVSLAVLKEYR